MFNFDISQDIECFILEKTKCKEYEIFKHLKSEGKLPANALATPLSLFRTHFLIYNALYRLQAKTLIHQNYAIDISSIEIVIRPFTLHVDSLNQSNISEFDPLALFYLDLNHLNQTSETDVNQLLDQFWLYYFDDGQKQQALKTLKLSEPVDSQIIKKQYRRLAMQHHPDRGGDANTLIEIHQAVQCLQQYYPT